jgi:bifunctional UDP-N-acetylglucosamine pyrophosphorylase/glucosamine-1-phosphate N-acetyltransferase
MDKLDIVILAAGKGERMVSRKPKVMHEIMGKPLLGYVVDRAQNLDPSRIIVVTGYRRESVEAFLQDKRVVTAFQAEQKGTAHALASAKGHLGGNDVLVLLGDVPLIQSDTLREFLAFCRSAESIVFLTTDVGDPSGYGRVLMDGDRITDIREHSDASDEERRIKRINTGICYIPFASFGLIDLIGADNAKGERYLTDICKVAGKQGKHARGFFCPRSEEVLGINNLKGLLEANVVMRQRINERHMNKGVTFLDTAIWIDDDVTIGADTVIAPNCHVTGTTVIGEMVSIGPSSIIRNCVIHDDVTIEGFVVMEGVEAKKGVAIGPFSRLRGGTVLEAGVRIGNFVEVKNSTLEANSQVNHLSYIGDARIGKNVNIGAGTITCNYDGVRKNRTVIEDGVLVGANTELVAPVRVGKGAVVGAGSTITEDVPDGSLAVSRTRQTNIEGYRRK